MDKFFYNAEEFNILPSKDPLSMLGMIFSSMRQIKSDRFDILNQYSPYNFTKDSDIFVPDTRNIPENIGTVQKICLNRAEEILNKAREEHKSINILLNSKSIIDSMCIVSSLLLVGADPEEFTIISNIKFEDLYSKYPIIAEDFINFQGVPYEENLLVKDKNFLLDNIVLLPNYANTLFGTNIVYYEYAQYWKEHFNLGFNKIIESLKDKYKSLFNYSFFPKARPIENISEENSVNYMLYLFEAFGYEIFLPIKYTCEAAWLYNFATNSENMNNYIRYCNLEESKMINLIDFYNTPEFQYWAIKNYTNLINIDPTDNKAYRSEFKDLIYEIIGDNDIFEMNDNKVFISSSNIIISNPIMNSTDQPVNRVRQRVNIPSYIVVKDENGYNKIEYPKHFTPIPINELFREREEFKFETSIPYLKDWAKEIYTNA